MAKCKSVGDSYALPPTSIHRGRIPPTTTFGLLSNDLCRTYREWKVSLSFSSFAQTWASLVPPFSRKRLTRLSRFSFYLFYIYMILFFFRFFFFLLLQTPVMFQTVRARRQGFYIFPSFFLRLFSYVFSFCPRSYLLPSFPRPSLRPSITPKSDGNPHRASPLD